MRQITLLIFLLLTLTFCNQKQTGIKNDLTYNSNLNKVSSDTLSIRTGKLRENYKHFFDDKEGFCKLSHDTIMIFNSSGIMTGKFLSVFITKDTFFFKSSAYSCTYQDKYKTIEQRLTLNKTNYNVNDTIIGDMFLKAIFVSDSAKNVIDTMIISGKFKYRIRDNDYSENTKYEEESYVRFMELTKLELDTFKSLDISACGLKSLPKELMLFKNIEILDISSNNFQNADLSSLCKLKNLKEINLNFCKLSRFPEGVLCNKKLKLLWLASNNIQVLPEELFSLYSLKDLDIENNNLTLLSDKISNLKNLESLWLNENKIKTLPKSIISLHKLKSFGEPDSLEYLPKQLAKLLSPYGGSYYKIGNYEEIKDLIPRQ